MHARLACLDANPLPVSCAASTSKRQIIARRISPVRNERSEWSTGLLAMHGVSAANGVESKRSQR